MKDAHCAKMFVGAGAIAPLLALASHGSDACRQHSFRSLRMLALDRDACVLMDSNPRHSWCMCPLRASIDTRALGSSSSSSSSASAATRCAEGRGTDSPTIRVPRSHTRREAIVRGGGKGLVDGLARYGARGVRVAAEEFAEVLEARVATSIDASGHARAVERRGRRESRRAIVEQRRCGGHAPRPQCARCNAGPRRFASPE